MAVPEHHRLIDWIPYWYAGYSEWLFYPPGTMLVGWLLNLFTLGKLSTALIYESSIFIAYALPVFTFYYVYRMNDYENAWLEARNADVDRISFEDTEIVLRVHAAQANASVNVKVYAYPL